MNLLAGWSELGLAVAAFFASHVVPARPAVRRLLHARLGGAAYAIIYSSVSLGVLAWLIAAAAHAPYFQLWDFELWQLWIPNIVMPLVCLLIAFGLAAPNPFSIAGRANERFDPKRPGIAAIARHPLLLAITLWALAHMVPNGDLAHAMLFGLFAAFGIAGMAALDGRRRKEWGPRLWAERAAKTSLIPFAAVFQGRVRLSELRVDPFRTASALALYVTLLAAHPLVIGVSPLPR